jgi:hypothetical protein
MGSVELHLRVRESSLFLKVEGDAAQVLGARAGELSRTLAAEGLRLAPVEVVPQDGVAWQSGGEQGGWQGEARQQAWNEAAEGRGSTPGPDGSRTGGGRSTAGAGASADAQPAPGPGRIHVRA